jgi:hypothetical protein
MSYFLQVLQGLMTPVIALLAVYIAWQQWRTNADKVKLDKFDRRFAIYDATRDLIRIIRQQSHATEKQVYDFRMKTRDASFLLDDELGAYLEQFANKAWDILMFESELEQENDSQKRGEIITKQRTLKDWLRTQDQPLRDKFTRYLTLKL